MKRFHLNLRVEDLAASEKFYTAFFGQAPTVDRSDYKKWMLDDPFINFSIEPSMGKTGIAHVGIQASSENELAAVYDRIADADAPTFKEGETQCCYAHSFKNWTRDPDGIVWEAFFTDGQRRDYGEMPDVAGLEA
ncbi:VOC family protein [Parerythrobacter jejuensis]|uniref:Glyoxalase/bleomycin resistance/dioxygenase family protein n=1 Tax=Parerythrobacter jejuensis TaxID=795812 RepID=A0A845AMD7_9SPHN|nr:VOC family protein [Parerythrobacter jejuensis]MXP31952.1 glyoxalase/bleomycin resistance/dioxygenase family protein [Parerythrobacter jejuensis]